MAEAPVELLQRVPLFADFERRDLQRLARSFRERTFGAGTSFHFSAADIHRVRHTGSSPSVTLHVYSPPLLRMGAYAVDDDGVLARHPMSYLEELKPLERAS